MENLKRLRCPRAIRGKPLKEKRKRVGAGRMPQAFGMPPTYMPMQQQTVAMTAASGAPVAKSPQRTVAEQTQKVPWNQPRPPASPATVTPLSEVLYFGPSTTRQKGKVPYVAVRKPPLTESTGRSPAATTSRKSTINQGGKEDPKVSYVARTTRELPSFPLRPPQSTTQVLTGQTPLPLKIPAATTMSTALVPTTTTRVIPAFGGSFPLGHEKIIIPQWNQPGYLASPVAVTPLHPPQSTTQASTGQTPLPLKIPVATTTSTALVPTTTTSVIPASGGSFLLVRGKTTIPPRKERQRQITGEAAPSSSKAPPGRSSGWKPNYTIQDFRNFVSRESTATQEKLWMYLPFWEEVIHVLSTPGTVSGPPDFNLKDFAERGCVLLATDDGRSLADVIRSISDIPDGSNATRFLMLVLCSRIATALNVDLFFQKDYSEQYHTLHYYNMGTILDLQYGAVQTSKMPGSKNALSVQQLAFVCEATHIILAVLAEQGKIELVDATKLFDILVNETPPRGEIFNLGVSVLDGEFQSGEFKRKVLQECARYFKDIAGYKYPHNKPAQKNQGVDEIIAFIKAKGFSSIKAGNQFMRYCFNRLKETAMEMPVEQYREMIRDFDTLEKSSAQDRNSFLAKLRIFLVTWVFGSHEMLAACLFYDQVMYYMLEKRFPGKEKEVLLNDWRWFFVLVMHMISTHRIPTIHSSWKTEDFTQPIRKYAFLSACQAMGVHADDIREVIRLQPMFFPISFEHASDVLTRNIRGKGPFIKMAPDDRASRYYLCTQIQRVFTIMSKYMGGDWPKKKPLGLPHEINCKTLAF